MAYDGLTMAAICKELQILVDARIERIYQPRKEIVLINLRNRKGDRFRLLLSAEASHAGVFLTDHEFTNPKSPPMFCMLLRKYLEGGKILSIAQPGLERVLTITVETYNEVRELCQRQLLCEVMGKHSNIILVDPDQNLILDGIKRYTHAVSRHREVIPGSNYIPPPPQNKENPLQISEGEMENGLLKSLGKSARQALIRLLEGVSPLLAKELIFRADLKEEIKIDECGAYEFQRLFQALQELKGELEAGCPYPSLVQGEKVFNAFSAFNLKQFSGQNIIHKPSVNETVDIYFQHLETNRAFQSLYQSIDYRLKRELDRCYKKAALQQETILSAEDADSFRIKGEILLAHLYHIQMGMKEVSLENFYDPQGETITIELLPELSPAENAQRYFRRYNRAKNAAEKSQIHFRKTKEEILYLEGVYHSMENAGSLDELEEINNELIEQGYMKQAPGPRGKAKAKERPEPLTFFSSTGFTFLVGRNNRQNDYLTLRIAKDEDLWFHTKDLPGSHVILQNPQGKTIPQQALDEGASLAAFFSKGRWGSKVPVDYTEIKYVRKPTGAKPGMVIYDHHQTLYVTPDEDLIGRLQTSTPEP